MASESELADLFLTLRAVTAPMLAGFAEVTSSGEEMVAALTAGLDALEARIAATAESLVAMREEMAGAGATGAVGLEGAAVGASTGAATAAAAAPVEGAAGGAEAAAAASTLAAETSAAATQVEVSYGQAGAAIDEFGNVFVKSAAKAAAEAAKAAAAIEAENQKLIDSAARLAAGADEAALQWSIDYQKMAAATAAAATKMEAAEAKAAGATAAFSAEQDKAAATAPGWQTKLGAVSGSLLKVGAAGGILGIAAIKMAGDFQQSTTRLVTSAGESEKAVTDSSGKIVGGLKYVQQGILDMAGEVGYSAKDLSTAMYTIESGGKHGAQGLDVLRASAQAAKTENADLTTVADAVTTAMTDYGTKVGTAAQVASKLVAATGQGKTTFQDLAGSMSAILPKASAAHISLDEILGDIASMTLHGISARQATQNLANAVGHLQSPTMQMSKEMAALGLNSTKLSQGLGTKGLTGTIQEISNAIHDRMGPQATAVILHMQDALKGLPKSVQDVSQGVLNGTESWADWNAATKGLTVTQRSQAQSFATLVNGMHTIGTEQLSGSQVMQTYAGAMNKAMGTTDGLNVALMLTGQNSNNTKKSIDAVTKATSDAQGNVKGWSEIQGTFNQKAAQAKDGFDAIAISVGMKLLPAASAILKVIANLTVGIGHNHTAVAILATVIGVMLAGGLVGAIGKLIVFGANMAKNLISPITGSIGLVKNFAGGLRGAEDAADTFGGKLGSAASSLGSFASSLGSSIASGAKWAGSMIAQGARVATASVINAGRATGAWIASNAKMVGQTAAQAARWAAELAIKYGQVALEATTTAATTSAAWIASMAKMAGQGLAQFAVWVAGMLAKFITVSAAAVVSALATAAAWIAANAAMIIATGGIVLLLGLVVVAAIYLWTHWHQIWGDIKAIALDVAHALRTAWDAVVSWLEDMGGKIGRLFSSAGKWLLNAGKAILEGLLNGLKAAWNDVTGFIGGIGSWISQHKGPIEVDRQLLTPHGNAIMAGLLTGLRQGGKQVASYLDGFTTTMGMPGSLGTVGMPSVSPGTRAMATAPGGGSGQIVVGAGAVQITVQGNVQTEQALVRAVQQGILQLSGRNSGFGLTSAFQ